MDQKLVVHFLKVDILLTITMLSYKNVWEIWLIIIDFDRLNAQ